MKTKIKLLKDYEDHKAGEIFTTDKAGADQLVADGIAEIVVAKVDLVKEAEVTKELIADVVAKAIKAELKHFPKVEVKEVPIYSAGDEGGGEFLLDVKSACTGGGMTERLQKYSNMIEAKAPAGNSTLVNTDGGYLVPEEFNLMLVNEMAIESKIANRTRQVPINSRIKLPYVNTTDMSGKAVGGVEVFWGNEGATLTASKAKIKQVELELKKVHALVYATDELLSDGGVSTENLLSILAGSALAREHDDVIVSGTGVGRPLGILSSPALITITRNTTTAIKIEDINNMWERISDHGNAVWLANRSTQPQIYTLALDVGTGGNSVFMFNVAERQSETIHGAPIIWTDHAKALGTKGDLILTDLSQYLTATKAGGPKIKSATSIHVRFLTDEVAFKFTMRVDGQPWWPAPRTPKNGNTSSPFVTLSTK